MRTAALLASIVLLGCPKEALDPSGTVSGFTDGPTPRPPTTDPEPPPPVLECRGDTQCPCSRGCSPAQTCGPTGACTAPCLVDADCTSGVSGEACIGGLCAVPCDPEVTDGGGCRESGMPEATCLMLSPVEFYCGYVRAG